jgi:methionyl-tRNA formyltransferase
MRRPSDVTLDPTTPVRVIFMGTPEFAVPSLQALANASTPGDIWPGGVHIVGVITRPDRPSGRGRQVAYSPVKQHALSAGLPIFQPGSLRRPEARRQIEDLAPHIIIVAAFGQILPPEILRLPTRGCLNVHASLLPRWRGASPIAAAIRAGDAETGVTIMAMDEGLDTGDIVASRATPIAPDETTETLTARLARLGAELLIETLPMWLAGHAPLTPQDDAHATLTRPLRKEDGRLDWSRPADELSRVIRAMTPWPGAYTTWNGKLLKVLEAAPIPRTRELAPGACYLLPPNDPNGPLACACAEGALALRVIQLEGKRALTSAEVLRGHPAIGAAALGQ